MNSTRCWPIPKVDDRDDRHPERRPHGTGRRSGESGQARHRREAAGDHAFKRCDAIIEACEKNKVKLATIFPSRFHESSREMLKKAIDGNRFGKLTMGDAYVKWFRTQQYYDSGSVARYLETRRRRRADESGDTQRRSSHMAHGPGGRDVVRSTATLAHERIAVEDTADGDAQVRQRRAGRHRGHDRRFPGLVESDRGARLAKARWCMEEEDLVKTGTFAKADKRDRMILEAMNSYGRAPAAAPPIPTAIGHHGHARQFE
jgi:UDP-N-acetyl-2-amino-2-deoxyglucuronate dehydrogenase